MARRRRNRDSDHFVTEVPQYDIVVRRRLVRLVEDRRHFHPEGAFAPPLSFGFPKSRLVVRNANNVRKVTPFKVPVLKAFSVPKRVAVCVRRKERREVIHAKRLTAKGAGGSKRRNFWSDVSC